MSVDFYDTSALLNMNDSALALLGTTDFFSPVSLEELEHIKLSASKDESIKAKARKVSRVLASTKATIFLFSRRKRNKIFKKYSFLTPEKNDHKLIVDAVLVGKTTKERVTFHTADINLFLTIQGLLNEDLIKAKLELLPEPRLKDAWPGWTVFPLKEGELEKIYANPTYNKVCARPNEYCVFTRNNTVEDILRWDGRSFVALNYSEIKAPCLSKIKPRNDEQKMAFDLLQNRTVPVKVMTGKYGTGKAQPNSTIIPTPFGNKKLGDIKVGDYVFDRTGMPTKVLGVFPQGIIDNYKITFNDGRTSYCNDQHIWPTYTSKRNIKNRTVSEMMEEPLISNSSCRYRIPISAPVQYEEKNLFIDPYLMGVLIGDGCLTEKSLTISSTDEELIQECFTKMPCKTYRRNSPKNYSWKFYIDDTIEKTSDDQIRLQTRQLLEKYPKLINASSQNKFIPEDYLYGSIQQRLSLLQGLLDTDGSIDKKKGRVRFTSVSFLLIQQVQQLCWSLGYGAIIHRDERDYKYTNGSCFNLQIICNNKEKINLFRLSRKKDIAKTLPDSKYSRDRNNIGIISIEKMEEKEEMTCLYVDNSEHLYLTEQYVVTHNTMVTLVHALYFIQRGLFDKLIFIRNNIEVKNTKDIGALPGSLQDKMMAWAMPLADHLGGEYALQQALEEGIIEILPLGFARGRNLERAIIFVDEAENLTREHVQLLLGRVGQGSELWILGDLRQTDKDVFEKNNGLRALLDRLAGHPKFGAVKLIKCERSETAALANLLD